VTGVPARLPRQACAGHCWPGHPAARERSTSGKACTSLGRSPSGRGPRSDLARATGNRRGQSRAHPMAGCHL